MFAPRFFSLLPLVLLAAVVAAGCTVPGSSRLQGPPDGLPPSLDLVTADVLGYTLYDTDPESKLWAALGDGAGPDLLAAQHAGLTGGFATDLDDVEPWIGNATGTVIREFDLDGKTDTSTLYFSDVRNRPKLEAFLDDNGWSREERRELSGGGLTGALWTHVSACDDVNPGTLPVCASPTYLAYEAALVTDDAVVAARTTKALKALLRSADEYAVPERKAMSEFTVEAADNVAAAFVFRADLIRTQVRRPFESDPALLEFARWATDSNVLIALRDGWIGLAPSLDEDRRDEAVRIVGAAEWVPDLAPDITLKPASGAILSDVGDGVRFAVAIDDPGQHLAELVRAITIGAGQYVTDQDVADESDRLELLPLLERMDGAAAISYAADYLELILEGDDDLAADITVALKHVGVDTTVGSIGAGRMFVRIPLDTGALKGTGSITRVETFREFAKAGTASNPPFAWFVAHGGGCIGDIAGWLSFDGTDRITLGADVELHAAAAAGEKPSSLVGICTESLSRKDG